MVLSHEEDMRIERVYIHNKLNRLYYRCIITTEEYDRLSDLILSPDKENMEVAKCLIDEFDSTRREDLGRR